MKRTLAVLLPVVVLWSATAGSARATGSASPGLSHAQASPCTTHGYSNGKCTVIGPGARGVFSVPAAGLEVSVGNSSGRAIDATNTTVATPNGAPGGSTCFQTSLYNHQTGQPVSGSPATPIVFTTAENVYSYDPATGQYVLLSKNANGQATSASPGTFCAAPASGSSSGGVTLPKTGGAAGR